MNALFKPSLGAPGHVIKILHAENGQKVDKFEPIYLGNYDIDEKCLVIFLRAINHLSFGDVHLPQFEYHFSCFVSFFFLFFCRYLLLNRETHCIES